MGRHSLETTHPNRRKILGLILGLVPSLSALYVATAGDNPVPIQSPSEVPSTSNLSSGPVITTPSRAPKYPDSTFGGVRPRVARIGNTVRNRFDVATVYGKASRTTTSDHPLGLALDFMTDRAKGDQVAAWFLANFSDLRISYVIWRQRINLGHGWERMEDRGSITDNHYNHVHVSFKP